MLHGLAMAQEAGVPCRLARIDQLSRRVPNICRVAPSSSWHMEDVHRAGGISAILAELARRPGLLDLDAGTVSGVTLGELIAGARVGDHDVIRRSRRHTVKPAAWPYSRATSPPGDRW